LDLRRKYPKFRGPFGSATSLLIEQSDRCVHGSGRFV